VREPELYQTAFGDPEQGLLPRDSLIVPLDCQGRLQGFAVLQKPAGVGRLNFEDHDILKTAGKQVAVAIAQALALERLAETRQFEAINKMTTFLMHDLKNVIAQQQLVVSNAGRFRHRPEFFDDAIATIRSGVERMRRVLDQLQVPPTVELRGSRSEGSRVLMEVRSHCADRQPVPQIEFPQSAVWVGMDRDKLASILGHLIRNAQDATPPDGYVRIGLSVADGTAVFSIADSGCGMDEVFVRDRLFRPFDSTKGARGMGIGAYQVRDIVRSAGGDVEVKSAPGAGTTFRVRLPLVQALQASEAAG
jgi:putative PEP-CTERM system histidine kinase